jgi:hypothetical protein
VNPNKRSPKIKSKFQVVEAAPSKGSVMQVYLSMVVPTQSLRNGLTGLHGLGGCGTTFGGAAERRKIENLVFALLLICSRGPALI